MVDFLIKLFMAVNVRLIRISRGRLGTHLLTQRILILHSVGRKSGIERLTPIAYFQADGTYYLVASNWGREHQAAWFYNLMSRPQTVVEIDGRRIPVEAHRAEGEEYDRHWKSAIQRYRPYAHYQEMTKRRIPIVVLAPMR
jgi:deazaflavin-dependent oxidoreductase (nitroreductase family)